MPSMSGGALRPLERMAMEQLGLFLCPRCRAGLCDYGRAHDVGTQVVVSMPSMSGGALRRMPSQGTCDLGV